MQLSELCPGGDVWFSFLSMLAGAGLLLLAGASLWSTLRGKPVHRHYGRLSIIVALGMVVMTGMPLTLGVRRFPERSSDAVSLMKVQAAPLPETGTAEAFTIGELERLCGGPTAEGCIPFGIEQVLQLALQPDDVKNVIESVRIETLGQLVRDPADPTRWRLSRLMITCCAADARAVSVAAEFDGDPSQWRQLGWYRVVGRVAVNGSGLPIFKVESIAPAEPPQNPLIY